MTKILHFPGTKCRLRERTKRELQLLFEENYRFYERWAYNATSQAWAQVEILRYTTQGLAESLYLLENHSFNAEQTHEQGRADRSLMESG